MNILLSLLLMFSIEFTPAIKGLAMAVNVPSDIDILKVEAYHNWSMTGSVPLTYGVPAVCASVMIVGNEPNAVAPYGAPMYPVWYAQLVMQIRMRCPDSLLVLGNVSVEDWRALGGQQEGVGWLKEMLSLLPTDNKFVIGAHCYSSSAAWCIEKLNEIKHLSRYPLWVTEYGVTTGSAVEMMKFMKWLSMNTEAYFAYTNRQPHTGQGWEITTGVELVDGDGALTNSGKVFADFILK